MFAVYCLWRVLLASLTSQPCCYIVKQLTRPKRMPSNPQALQELLCSASPDNPYTPNPKLTEPSAIKKGEGTEAGRVESCAATSARSPKPHGPINT